ncbi:MAG: SRPBCC domain-containing protein, partial [Asticcacaulis sp.]|nr:SRPBCC domain-containing protein [Asticcacaulis sp.]
MPDTLVTTEHRDLILMRHFAAPRALVFRAWTDPQMLAAWWGPEGLTTAVQMDLRDGGEFTLVMSDGKGGDYPITGRFGPIIANEAIVMIMEVERHPPEWHAMIRAKYEELGGKPEDYVGGPIPTKILFSDDGDGTVVTIRQIFPLALVR